MSDYDTISRDSFDFDQVVHAVDDLGMDPQGNEPINDALESALNQSGTCVKFPAGEFYLAPGRNTAGWVQMQRADENGIVGAGPEATQFVTDTDMTGRGRYYSPRLVNSISDGAGFLLADVGVDMGRETTGGAIGIHILLGDKFLAEDVTWHGHTPDRDHGDDFKLMACLRNGSGRGVMRRLTSVGPSTIASHLGNHGMGILSEHHAGHMVVEDFHFENEPGDGSYYTQGYGNPDEGAVTFRNGYAKNAAMAGLRCGGPSRIEGCTIVVDHDDQHPANTKSNAGDMGYGWDAAHGIMWASQGPNPHGIRADGKVNVEDTDIILRSNDSDAVSHALRINGTGNALSFKNVRIYDAIPGEPVVKTVEPGTGYGNYDPDPPHWIRMDGCHITVPEGVDKPCIVELNGREDSRFDCEVSAPGADVGVDATRSPGTVVRGAWDVGGAATRGSGLDVDVTTGAAPVQPKDSGGPPGYEAPTWRTLRVAAPDGAGRVTYEAAVNGVAELGNQANPADDHVTLADGTAVINGVVLGGGADTFRVDGEVVDLMVNGEAVVTLDGEDLSFRGGSGADEDADSGGDSPASEPVSETIRVDVSDGQGMAYDSVELRVESDGSLSIQTVDE